MSAGGQGLSERDVGDQQGAYLPIKLEKCRLSMLAFVYTVRGLHFTHHLIITYWADHPRACRRCRLGSSMLVKSDSGCDVLILDGYGRARSLRAEGY